MKHINSIILTLLTTLFALTASAQDFEYEGIIYTIINSEAKTVMTKDGISDNHTAHNPDYTPGNNVEGDVTIPSVVNYGGVDYTVIRIGQCGFCNLPGLRSVVIPETVQRIGAFAFCGCNALENVIIPDGIEELPVYVFKGCSSLKSIELPQSIIHIREQAFGDCSSLESIEIPESVVDFQYSVFGNCTALSSVKLPKSMNNLGNSTFFNCIELKSINIPERLTKLGQGVFENCQNLSKINLPDSITEIGMIAFSNCSSLESIVIPELVDSIGIAAFQNCLNLKSVTFPENISTISERLFYNCKNINDVYYGAVHPVPSEENVFDDEVYNHASLNTPNATLASVQSTMPWNKFLRINASDGTVEPGLAAGDDFEYEGIRYTVIDADAKTVRTKEGHYDIELHKWVGANLLDGEVVIPSVVSYGDNDFYVVEVGQHGFEAAGVVSVNIPETVTSIRTAAFMGCSNLIFVSIPESVTTIGENAFDNCIKLTSIHLPNGLTKIETNVFQSCNNLSEVNMPESLTSIEMGAFNLCAMTSLELPEGLQHIGFWAFQQNPLVSVTIPASLTSIEEAPFNVCFWIEDVTYLAESPVELDESLFPDAIYESAVLHTPNATLASVQATTPWNKFLRINASDGSVEPGLAAGEDFEYEGIWYSVIDPKAKTCKTKDGGRDENDIIFSGNTFNGNLIIPEIVSYGDHVYTVTEIGQLGFNRCDSIISVKLPNSLKYIGDHAFRECAELTSIILPESLEGMGISVFKECPKLDSISIPNSVTEIKEWTFSMCNSLESIRLPESLEFIGNFAFEFCPITSLYFSDSLKEIHEYAFMGSENISSVTYDAATPIQTVEIFPERVYNRALLTMKNATLAEIRATEKWNKFRRVVASDGIDDPGILPEAGDDFEYEGIWYTVLDAEAKTCMTKEGPYDYDVNDWIPGNYCEGDVTIPSIVSDGTNDYTVVSIGISGFYNCSSLTSITIPEGVTSIGVAAFMNCSSLTSINIPEKVTSIENTTFYGCSSLISLLLPDELTSIGQDAFGWCSNLISINIPESVRSIGHYAFDQCSSLTSIIIPEGLTSIEAGVFQDCLGLTSIKIPEGVTSICRYSFNGCSNLSSIDIPEGVTSIEEGAFYRCSLLTTINLPSTLSSIEENAFVGCNPNAEILYLAESPIIAPENTFEDLYTTATLTTPNATLASVQATTPWNKFLRINASDGSISPLGVGEDFEFDGINYTVIDEENHLIQTKNGYPEIGESSNSVEGNLIIPSKVTYDGYEYTVTEIGYYSFFNNPYLLSVTIPGSVNYISWDAFDGCERLTSIVWQGDFPLPMKEIKNPNILVYVDDAKYAPEWLDHNIVAAGVCDNLVLTPGYAFTPLTAFTAEHSEITKLFTQQTPVGGCAGWETLAIPFEPTSITVSDGRALVPFSAFTDIDTQCPFWLYEADAAGEWKEASAIHQGVPYILAMPNNDEYADQYRVDGEVTFLTDEETLIAPETCAPYVTTWNSGREFRSLWLPLSASEAADAMGLNVGISNLTGDDGKQLAPGSAFHTDVLPKPLEAYVTRIDGRRAMPVRGDQSFLTMLGTECGLRITTDSGSIILSSDLDRTVEILTMDGIIIRRAYVKAGEPYHIDNLTRGIYIVAGSKITVK